MRSGTATLVEEEFLENYGLLAITSVRTLWRPEDQSFLQRRQAREPNRFREQERLEG
jgi:hypothetical protein